MRFIASILAVASVALASVVTRQNAVPVPEVLYPHGTAVWVVGVRHNVTWNGAGVSGTNGKIWLAKGPVVDTSAPLATGFDLARGRVELTVPSVEPATDYTVLLDIGGQTKSSIPFTIARSNNDLPQAQPPASGVTTVVFPGTTIVTNVGGGPSGSIVTVIVPSASASASSPVQSVSSPVPSASQPLPTASNSVSRPVSGQASATGSGSGGAPSPTSSQTGNSAVSLALSQGQFFVAAIAFFSGAMLLF